MKESVLEKKWLRVDDVTIGDIVKVRVLTRTTETESNKRDAGDHYESHRSGPFRFYLRQCSCCDLAQSFRRCTAITS